MQSRNTQEGEKKDNWKVENSRRKSRTPVGKNESGRLLVRLNVSRDITSVPTYLVRDGEPTPQELQPWPVRDVVPDHMFINKLLITWFNNLKPLTKLLDVIQSHYLIVLVISR